MFTDLSDTIQNMLVPSDEQLLKQYEDTNDRKADTSLLDKNLKFSDAKDRKDDISLVENNSKLSYYKTGCFGKTKISQNGTNALPGVEHVFPPKKVHTSSKIVVLPKREHDFSKMVHDLPKREHDVPKTVHVLLKEEQDFPKAVHVCPKMEQNLPKGDHDLPKTVHVLPKTEHDLSKMVYGVLKEGDFPEPEDQFPKLTDEVSRDGTSLEFARHLETLRHLHLQMCACVDAMDTTLRRVLASTYATSIPLICFLLYTLVATSHDWFTAANLVSWTTFNLVQSTLISVACARVHEAAHSPLKYLYNTDITATTAVERDQLYLFLSKLTGSPIGFSVLSIRLVTKEMILTLAGMLLTYFFLLLQFKI